jgi:long-chain acyl-CoA synthetase
MSAERLILDYVYDHEAAHANRVWLTQPLGNDAVRDYTWGQALDEARRMAAHLRSMGLQPGDRVGMLSKNCAHFFIAELAIWIGGFTTVAIFPTEGPETVQYVLEHSEAKVIFVGKLDAWHSQEPGVPAGIARIALPLAPATDFDTWDSIIARTAPLTGRQGRAADDLALILYTSGSTGTPKGVMHNFRGVTRAAEGIVRGIQLKPEDRAISYLPLAHVFERAYIECAAMVNPGHVFFTESLDTFVRDIQRARPTIFISVPRLWVKFQLGVFAKMPPAKLDRLLRIPILGKIVARKVLKGLGLDQVRLAGSGSAPIPAELISWYRRLGLNLLEGYAMSEDFAYSHLSTDTKKAPGWVGVPYDDVQVRIAEDGEILIKSSGCMVGYYKRPDLDAESFTSDGFFRTGDTGERRADGLLRITGRKKELFKTAKGKYVAPSPIENRLNEHAMVELSCVTGVGQPAAYALVVLSDEWRARAGDSADRAQIERELQALLHQVNSHLAEYEILQMIVVSRQPWSIEDGTLTPTMKIKRSAIEAAVAPKVEGWYKAGKPVVWG